MGCTAPLSAVEALGPAHTPRVRYTRPTPGQPQEGHDVRLSNNQHDPDLMPGSLSSMEHCQSHGKPSVQAMENCWIGLDGLRWWPRLHNRCKYKALT